MNTVAAIGAVVRGAFAGVLKIAPPPAAQSRDTRLISLARSQCPSFEHSIPTPFAQRLSELVGSTGKVQREVNACDEGGEDRSFSRRVFAISHTSMHW